MFSALRSSYDQWTRLEQHNKNPRSIHPSSVVHHPPSSSTTATATVVAIATIAAVAIAIANQRATVRREGRRLRARRPMTFPTAAAAIVVTTPGASAAAIAVTVNAAIVVVAAFARSARATPMMAMVVGDEGTPQLLRLWLSSAGRRRWWSGSVLDWSAR
ncbi:hypothetical protein Dimus_039533 [Dionaea muscipula]